MKIKRLDEGTDSNRKKQFAELYKKQYNETIDISNIEQHHINGNHNDNPKDLSNLAYFCSPDKKANHDLHMLVHAKKKLEYIRNQLNNTKNIKIYIVENNKLVIKNIDYLISKLYKDYDLIFKLEENNDQ